MRDQSAADAWDREYGGGRYRDEPPVAFVDDIIASVRRHGLLGSPGLYIGCGNGRNYIPLVQGGLELTGVDVSRSAIEELAGRMPERADRVIHGDITALSMGARFAIVIAIQVFQHGDRTACHTHVRDAQRLVALDGLMAVRVNSVNTDIEYEHEVIEAEPGAGFTIRYLEGPKRGLSIHFFERDELEDLFAEQFHVEMPLRLRSTPRNAPAKGRWSQWEGLWRRAPDG